MEERTMEMNETKQVPQLSQMGTIATMFLDPGRVFDDLNKRPRFILALILVAVSVSVMNYVIVSKAGFERVLREQLDKSSATQQLSSEQKERIVEQQTGTAMTVVRHVSPPLVVVIITLLGGLYYFVGCNAMDGSATFVKGITVWAYSSIPPTLVLCIANIIVAAFKSADDIDIASLQGGLFKANPTLFLDVDGAFGALLGALDLFAVWGWILAAIGLKRLGKVSTGAAWGIVGLLALVGITAKVVTAALFRG